MCHHAMEEGQLINLLFDCGSLNFVEPYDQVMADRGFKIKDELLMSNAYLCIAPSTKAGLQMVPTEVKETSWIAS